MGFTANEKKSFRILDYFRIRVEYKLLKEHSKYSYFYLLWSYLKNCWSNEMFFHYHSTTVCADQPIISSRVMGGTATLPGNYPWMVRLAYGNNANMRCAGVLVGKDTVLTVAHCINV